MTSQGQGFLDRFVPNAQAKWDRVAAASVKRGAPPRWFGYRGVIRESVPEYFGRHSGDTTAGHYETVHPEAVASNPLPDNFSSPDELPDDRGWWGYSFRDVPHRISGETFMATVPDCLITWYRNPEQENDFYPAILNRDSRAFDMREVRFRPMHAETLRQSPEPARLKRATWFIERVYHNHSHWLTAHLPKLLLLREKGMLDQVILPPERSAAIDGCLRMLGLKPEQFQTYDPARPLFVEELTIMGTDRFRPELLRMVPQAFGINEAVKPHRKVFISRLHAARRRLVNEEEIWALLEPQGFERVLMENMTFEDQVRLMSETAVLVAPHGAGLTNMLFCPEGAHIVEIADLSFPNPNFYALASALGHRYSLARAESLGDVHPLEKDLKVDPSRVTEILPRTDRPSATRPLEHS
ncbi:glycosyltransferase family 61 protein [Marinobacter salicampi]|uniref:glycosyltransferase family 61 protein n=1 Tax=Marinobacter salicampi TaxID=435907 RepID=UPI00140AACC0|nr:glycosyltransferase family 61 protein [Marinobacter salicampi]